VFYKTSQFNMNVNMNDDEANLDVEIAELTIECEQAKLFMLKASIKLAQLKENKNKLRNQSKDDSKSQSKLRNQSKDDSKSQSKDDSRIENLRDQRSNNLGIENLRDQRSNNLGINNLRINDSRINNVRINESKQKKICNFGPNCNRINDSLHSDEFDHTTFVRCCSHHVNCNKINDSEHTNLYLHPPHGINGTDICHHYLLNRCSIKNCTKIHANVCNRRSECPHKNDINHNKYFWHPQENESKSESDDKVKSDNNEDKTDNNEDKTDNNVSDSYASKV